ncbi:MAG: lipopolysaccharide A protein [Campylobacterales bacterium]|nr:lipopolysaccharide A protein [Campylobacterales bacterium]
MKLNRVRHFIFVNDSLPYEAKENKLVWRGGVHVPHRIAFMEQFFDHPLCDIGQTNRDKTLKWIKKRMSIKEQLKYKFILSIEGNDVASNLKWAMSSNCLVMMTKPKYETWFMEGQLIPNHHYVLLQDDYGDLEEKMHYYTQHIDEAKAIIANANAYIEPFKNKQQEDLISYLVLQKYFKDSKQLEG